MENVASGFTLIYSAVNQILTKKKKALTVSEREDIHMMLTKIEPNIQDITPKHQPQG